MDILPASQDLAAPAEEPRLTRPDSRKLVQTADVMVSVPMSELFTIAARQERAGNLQEADRLLNHILAVAPN